jgi:hypothetical protein
MSPILVLFMRRLAVVALLLAVGLLVLPRALAELGFLGPTPEELVANAAAALQAAHDYGAEDSLPSFAAARKELEAARALLSAGRRREARRAALEASEKAITAQRDGLIHRDAARRRASAIVTEADRRLNELEALYGRAAKAADALHRAELLSLMKGARQAGSGLVLMYERDDFARVIAGEKDAFATLDTVREALRKALER